MGRTLPQSRLFWTTWPSELLDSWYPLGPSWLILSLLVWRYTLNRQENQKLKEQIAGGGEVAQKPETKVTETKEEAAKEELAKTKVEVAMTQQVNKTLYPWWSGPRLSKINVVLWAVIICLASLVSGEAVRSYDWTKWVITVLHWNMRVLAQVVKSIMILRVVPVRIVIC